MFKKVDRVIQCNQKSWLKPYIDMNTKLGTEAKNDLEKDFFKLMNNAVLGKIMENIRNHRDVKLVTTDKRRNQLASEPSYHKPKYSSENLMTTEMKKQKKKWINWSILACQYQILAKHLRMNFGMITLNQNIRTEQNNVTWILKALLFKLKL